ncbi:MraY family glycosyltransferase [Spongisporangium articulatum]|uniref:MraY family glycosyltransferase n=1 Tax=Spongisporangium articulatum TaxID=3362603 RepID=A0ABW8AVN2_9ACTN
MRGYLFVLVVAAAVTYLTTPAARRIARRFGAITEVRERDVHTVPIPRLGGTAIYLGIAVSLLIASRVPFFEGIFDSREPWIVLLCAGAICLLGVADDLWTLDAVTKFAGQALVAGVMAWQGLQLVLLPLGGVWIPSPGVLIVLTVLAVVICINAVNFVDGLDGLAAGIVAIAGSAFFVYAYLLTKDLNKQDYSSLAALITASLVGACVGFLPHNFNPARIFMGDSGSMLIGLLLAASTVEITGKIDPDAVYAGRILPAFLPVVLPLAVIALPLIDLFLAVFRRTRAGQKFWQPDKLHLHHRMLAIGHSHMRAVLILYFWTATVGFGVALFAVLPAHWASLIAALSVLLALALTLGPLRGRLAAARLAALEAGRSIAEANRIAAAAQEAEDAEAQGTAVATHDPDVDPALRVAEGPEVPGAPAPGKAS